MISMAEVERLAGMVANRAVESCYRHDWYRERGHVAEAAIWEETANDWRTIADIVLASASASEAAERLEAALRAEIARLHAELRRRDAAIAMRPTTKISMEGPGWSQHWEFDAPRDAWVDFAADAAVSDGVSTASGAITEQRGS